MHVKKNFALAVVLLNLTLAIYASNFPKKPLTVALANGTNSPSIESCDMEGNTVNEFDPGDQVYVKGNGLEPGGLYNIYIVQDYSFWKLYETEITDLYVVVGPVTVDVDAVGGIENQPALIWEAASPGSYDIWADSLTDGEQEVYDECDVVYKLGVEEPGFIVIPEMLIVAIPVLFAYLTAISARRRRLQSKSITKQPAP